MKLSEAVQKRIKELAAERGISVYRLSALSGVPRSTISTLNISRTATLSTVYGICEGLGITLAEFFDSPLFARENIED